MLPTSPPGWPSVDKTMIGNLPHDIVDHKLALAVFITCDKRQRLDHEGALFGARSLAMFAKHRHRSVTGIALEQREFKRQSKSCVPGGIFLQLAEIAFCHSAKRL